MIKYNPEPISGIPKVKVLDENGKVVGEGYYFWYPRYCSYPISDNVQEIECIHGIVTYEQGDWGLPNSPKFRQVDGNFRIELCEK